jgi:hypothetical protein
VHPGTAAVRAYHQQKTRLLRIIGRAAQPADTRPLLTAQQEARRVIEADPTLAQPEHAALLARIEAFWSEGVPSG